MEQNIPVVTEEHLALALQPIRGFVLAQALYHFMDQGIQAAIKTSNGLKICELAQSLKLNERRLFGFLQYLANEDFVELRDNESVWLTNKGHEIADFYPWYKLLVGGYAQTFQQLSITLKAGSPYATRDTSSVGIGSCGISQHDALPMTRRLLSRIKGEWHTVVDLGCGDGSYLVDLCRSIPGIRGLGFDSEAASVEVARRAAIEYGIDDRLEVRLSRTTTLPDLSAEIGPFCFITAFVFQGILEQSGRDAVLNMLSSTFDRYPDSHWIVIEVDHRPQDPSVMKNSLGLAYYNPYYLIHFFTEQRLAGVQFWEQLFRDAGLNVTAIEHPKSSYDSLGLKVGFLLERQGYVSIEP